MGCSETGVEVGPGFEDGGGDVVLGEEDGEEEAGGAGSRDEDLTVLFSAMGSIV